MLILFTACTLFKPKGPAIPLERIEIPENTITETVDSSPELNPEYPSCPDFLEGSAYSAFIWPLEKSELRTGENITTLEKIGLTKEEPIEVCGANQQQQWIQSAACPADFNQAGGQNPVDYRRLGSVGSGGRCGKIIDHYEVICQYGEQSKSHLIYMDMYHCTQQECDADFAAPCP